jgi:hypothetical protein
MAYHAAQLSMLLPPSVPFLIVSNDRDLFHTMGHLLTSGRRTFMFNKLLNIQYIDGILVSVSFRSFLLNSSTFF